MKTSKLIINTLLTTALIFTQIASAEQQQKKQQGDPKLPVGFITVNPKTINLTKNLPGRLVAVRDAMVRARVTGIVEKRLFQEGSYVRAGEPLFQIDDRQFRANLTSAKAQLAQAQASQKLSAGDVKRYRHLLKSKAISRQVYVCQSYCPH